MDSCQLDASHTLALDLMLTQLVKSDEFSQLTDKNWDSLSRLIPGTTPRQCSKRYEDLCKQVVSQDFSSAGGGPLKQQFSRHSTRTEAEDTNSNKPPSRPSSVKFKGESKIEKHGSAKLHSKNLDDLGPLMTIHVCDEAKNLKQDFHCPRDLLVKEMRYFSEYLSNDAQRWEEVDISVHCDVQIFEWLMKYVKRYTSEIENPPKLEPNNVISILISSDFLKMDSLVSECVEYCHEKLSAIVATPCNMNCINDTLLTRIADLFTHNELEDVKDRKDKFKSKLFAKKLEKLFDPTPSSMCSPESAASLFRCTECKKLMTKTLEKKLKCSMSRVTVDRVGNLSFSHVKDPSFNVSDYLLEMKNELKSWRDVYWHIWGTVNYLTCSRCADVFQCRDLGLCRYHPERATFEALLENGTKTSAVGEYPCCNQKAMRFDPNKHNKGCKFRDHVVSLSSWQKSDSEETSQTQSCIYDDLMAHRDVICHMTSNSTDTKSSEETGDEFTELFANESKEFSVFENEKILLGNKRQDSSLPSSKVLHEMGKTVAGPRLGALTIEEDVPHDNIEQYGESDDELGDDEVPKARRTRQKRRVTVDPQAILVDAPDFSTTKSRKWDGSKSLRWNQDAQREEDLRRMTDIVSYLTKLRLNNEKLERKQKEYAGGIYSKLEAQWKTQNLTSFKGLKEPVRGKQKPFGGRQTTLSA